jgi:hypothetical protein
MPPLSPAHAAAARNAASLFIASSVVPPSAASVRLAAQAGADAVPPLAGAGPGWQYIAVGWYIVYVRCSLCGRAGGGSDDDAGDDDEAESFGEESDAGPASSSSAASPNRRMSCKNLATQVSICHRSAGEFGGVYREPVFRETEFFEGSATSTGYRGLQQLVGVVELAEKLRQEAVASGQPASNENALTLFIQEPARLGRRMQKHAQHAFDNGKKTDAPHPRYMGHDVFVARMQAAGTMDRQQHAMHCQDRC